MMGDFSALHFLRPWWLLVSVPALVVAALSLVRSRESRQWKGVIAPHLLSHLVTGQGASRWLSPELVLLPFALVLAVAMAGPAYRVAETPEGPDDTTLLIAADLSGSMAGRDVGPSRIGRLRLKLRDLINLRSNGRVGLIAVAGSAHVVMPPTDDPDALVPYVDVLDPHLMPQDGENFGALVPLVQSLSKSSKGPTVLLVAADSIPPDGAQALAALLGGRISIVGWAVGTKEGIAGAGIPGLDRSGFEVLKRAGAQVVDLSLGTQDTRQIADILDRARTASVDPDDASLWIDSGYSLVFVFAIGVLFWFRRGWVMGRASLLLLVLLLTGCEGSDPKHLWLDLWMTPDQQGRYLFDQGKYEEAASVFQNPMWKGISYYTAHKWTKAQEQFARVDTVEGNYNLANAYAQDRQIATAIAKYDAVLKRRPTFRAARKNRDYFREVLAGLTQTDDMEETGKPPQQPADPSATKFRQDQIQGPDDLAEQNEEKANKQKKSLSKAENERWMQQVATNPGEFLRAKFAVQEQKATP